MKRRAFLAQSLGAATAVQGLTACRAPAAPPLEGGWVGADPNRAHAALGLSRGSASTVSVPHAVRSVHTLIAGGGVAGLAAARGLMQRGVDDFAVLELEDEAGGNARAGQLQGLACPWGAHYLPVPGNDQPHLQALLAEMGLLQRDAAGRWQPDERHLCHSPQERLWFNGQWQPGLLPMEGVGADTLAQYHRFGQLVEQAQRQAQSGGGAGRFRVPYVGQMRLEVVQRHGSSNSNKNSHLPLLFIELNALVFSDWLRQNHLTDPHLLWYLDYVCRDEYGAGIAQVSAWAGVHYFAARHGFAVPGETEPGQAVFTWPQGNAFVTHHMAQTLGGAAGGRLHTGWAVQRVAQERQQVLVDVQHVQTGERVRWKARHVVLALPAHVAARVLDGEPSATLQQVREAAAALSHAAWVVVNLHLRRPLTDRGGAAPAWDNVAFGTGELGQTGLGYVDATHQALHRPRQAPTVLTHYRALGTELSVRQTLRDQPWTHWVNQSVAEWQEAHPELPSLITQASVARYGHGMVVPVPGFLTHAARWQSLSVGSHAGPSVRWAHSDASGMSTFEEAFAQGLAAGLEMARRQA